MNEPTTDLALDEINVAANATFMRPDLHGIFRKLRLERPVSWHQHPDSGQKGFWAVTRYEDIVAVNRKPDIFSNSQGIQAIIENDSPRAGKGSLIEMDPPEHTKYRRLLMEAFTSKAVLRLSERIERAVEQTLDRLVGRSSFDVVSDFATPIPLQFFYDLVGVPSEDQAEILELADLLFFGADPRHGGKREAMQEAGIKLQAYGRQLGLKKRENPGDDLMSILAAAEVDGRPLTEVELGSFFGLIGGAGADTTRAVLAWGVNALCQHPEQKALWMSDLEGFADTAVDEIIRWATPTMFMRRTALQDTEIAGQAVKAGDKVLLWWVSGNRDETVIENPNQFDITRKPNRHMAFGVGGPHYCLGVHLARLEIKMALMALLKRFPNIRADVPATRLEGNFINGPKALTVFV